MLPLRSIIATFSILLFVYFSFSRLEELHSLGEIINGKERQTALVGNVVEENVQGNENESLNTTVQDNITDTTSSHSDSSGSAQSTSELQDQNLPRIGIVSMLYGDNVIHYERSLASHIRYAARHGYGVHILRTELVEGIWNKLVYLQHVLTQELERPEEERTQWLMWVDADSIVINPAIALEIFLPPESFSNIHLIVSKDQNGFNAGMFFIRVHQTSIMLINKALAFPQFRPEARLDFLEQTALYFVYREEQFRSHVIYEPRIWFNAYELNDGYEGQPGNIFVHFAGLDNRWDRMSKWLDIIEGNQSVEWELPLDRTTYSSEVEKFWYAVEFGEATLALAENSLGDEPNDAPQEVKNVVAGLKEVMWSETDDVDRVISAIEALKATMNLPKS